MDNAENNIDNSDIPNKIEPSDSAKVKNSKWLFILSGIVLVLITGLVTYKFLILNKTKNSKTTLTNEVITETLNEVSDSKNAFGTLLSQSNNVETTKPSATEANLSAQSNLSNNTIKDNTTIEEKASESEKTIPENNDKPSIKLTSGGYKDRTFSEDDSINLSLTAEDNVGGISYVEFYINGEKDKTVQYRELYDQDASGWDPGEGDRGTNIASEFLEDKYDDNDIGYSYRHYKKFDTTKSSCGFSEGYIFIMAGDKYLYDVRMKKGLEDVKVCYKGDSINYNDNYIYLFKGDDGDYEFYAKAYDKYGASAKSEKVEFEID